jgi:PAS domain S-box-containing protein
MGPIVYVNILVEGLLLFAALHYFLLWWWSRRNRVLLVFAVFSALIAVVTASVVRLSTAGSVEAAQTALDLRTTLGVLGYPLLVYLVSEISGVAARWYFRLVSGVCVAAAAVSALGAAVNGTIVSVGQTQLPWGETLNVVERGPVGPWVAPLYAVLLSVHVFTLYAAWRSRRDRLMGGLIALTGLAALTSSGVSVLIDLVRMALPHLGVFQFAIWVPVLSLLLSRESARRDERLAASEARYRTLTESAPEAIVVLDMGAGRFVDCNQKAIDLFGWSAEELLTKSPIDISPAVQPDGRPSGDMAGGYLRQAMEGGTPAFEWVHQARDGRSIPCDIRLVRLPDPRRMLVRGSMTDITERKRAEAAMRDIESRHSAILESSLDGLIVVNASSRILEFNQAAETIFGHRRGDVIGRDLAEVLIPAPLREAHRTGMQRFLTSGVAAVIGRRLEMPALRADGSEVRVELSIQPIAGTPPLFAGVVRDITERLRLEEQLRQSQKMEAVGQLAGGVAHDFNNLLTVIAGYCGILLDRLPPTDPLREDVRAISDAGQRAASLTQRLLAFSRQAVLTPKVVDINTIVRDADQILRRLIGEDILLTVALDRHAGHVKVDPGHIGQVLINLALNARDALPSGGRLSIETGAVRLDETAVQGKPDLSPGPYIRLVVSDTGAGMPPEVKARIFEPFFTTKGVGRGTGLGLSVVHGIVKQSGGHIEVESEEGAGSTFTIYLPQAQDAPAPRRQDEGAPRAHGVETILLVEDEAAVRHLLARGLRSHGFTVLTAGDGVEALRLARDHRGVIDLLATDVVMPNMSGRDLADSLRRERDGLKVLFMSGYTDDTLLRHGVFEQREAFLQKPFALQAFASKVREMLDER